MTLKDVKEVHQMRICIKCDIIMSELAKNVRENKKINNVDKQFFEEKD